jgi:hypothetical protein
MDSIRVSEAPDTGSIPVEATNVLFGQIWDEKGQKRPLILLEQLVFATVDHSNNPTHFYW